MFLLGLLAGIWIVKGNLNYSYTLDFLPLTDPYVALQAAMTGHFPESFGLIGSPSRSSSISWLAAAFIAAGVCPVNLVTDAAGLAARPPGHQGQQHPTRRNTRYWILGMTFGRLGGGGVVLWELINRCRCCTAA